jgi:hypothetical protein
MRLPKIVLFFLSLVFFCVYSVIAEIEVFTVSYECSDSKGSLRWRAVTEIFTPAGKEESISMLIEQGKGIYGGFKQEVSWQSELEYIKQAGQIRPVKSQTRIFSTSGELLSFESHEFDYNSNEVTFKREDKKSGKEYKEVFEIKEDIVNRLMLGPYVQQFLRSGKQEVTIQMLSNEPRITKCRLYIVGKEEIEMGGQLRQAYKLCLDPQLGLLNFVKVLIPKAYIWHSAEPDYQWLKYNGLEVNLSSPVVDIIKLEPDKLQY